MRDLRGTGDEITQIEGIFSGTLAYLFNVFDGSESFSSIVRAAKAKGYTEPDPRDDLSGIDVARKLIILGREMGLTLEIADVQVEGLVPEALTQCSVEEFMARLPESDAAMAAACQQRSCALRAEELGFEVGVQHSIPLRIRGFGKGGGGKDRRVVHQDVEAAEPLFGAFEEAGYFSGAR